MLFYIKCALYINSIYYTVVKRIMLNTLSIKYNDNILH